MGKKSGSSNLNAASDWDPANDADRDPADSEDYVGWKHPPKGSQFKTGQPRPEGAGRQKGSLNKSTIRKRLFKFYFETSVLVKSKDGTSSRTISRFDALLTTGYERAVKGSSRDFKTQMDMILRLADDEQDSDEKLARMMKELSSY